MSASREGTISVGFSDVVIAMMAPSVTKVAAPQGKYCDAPPVQSVPLLCNWDKGRTPNATVDISTKIKAVALIPLRKTHGKRRVLSLVSPAVWANDSNPA